LDGKLLLAAGKKISFRSSDSREASHGIETKPSRHVGNEFNLLEIRYTHMEG
jgi:hypothetical protein